MLLSIVLSLGVSTLHLPPPPPPPSFEMGTPSIAKLGRAREDVARARQAVRSEAAVPRAMTIAEF